MSQLAQVVVSAAVEGDIDEAVARKLIMFVGGSPGAVYGRSGKDSLRRKIGGYNNAARHSPWVVMVDLDTEADCAPQLRRQWLPQPAPLLCFRIVVREVEAWLMADSESLARFLNVRRDLVPNDPEHVIRPKEAMVDLGSRSRRSDLRSDMVPRPGSGRTVGRAYSSRLLEYVAGHWRPEVAAERADSLRRAIRCLRRLVA